MKPEALRFRRCGAARSRSFGTATPPSRRSTPSAASHIAGGVARPSPAVSRTAALAARRKIVKTAGDRGPTLSGRGGYGADAQYLGSPLQMANPFSGTQYSMQAP